MRIIHLTSLIIVSIFIFTLSGCSTKREYFEPKKVSWKVNYDGSLPAKIVDVTNGGATLENGQIITSTGLKNVKLPKGYSLLGVYKNRYLASSDCGELIVVNNNSQITYKKRFSNSIASASIKEDLISLVLSTNRLIVLNIKNDKILFNNKQDDVYALDSRIASPYFLGTLIVFPSLDGKLIIVDNKKFNIVKSVAISNEEFFGNVIYLNVLGNRLVAATKKRVISINPKSMGILDKDVKDVIVLKNRVFVFTKDGEVILCDADLNQLKSRKFRFAVFSGVIYGKFIYMIERGGYLIATDDNLISTNIYKLPDSINSYLYCTKDTLYYEDKYFKLAKQKE